MPQFTKGKWTYAPPPNDKNKTYGVFGAEGKEIILVALVEKQANARLIAEAPAMYELLNRTLDFLVKHDIDDKLKLDIDYCILRANGSPLQCVYERERKKNNGEV